MLDNSQPRGWHKEIRDSRPTVSRHWKIYDIFGYFEDFWEFRGKKIRLFLGQLHFTWQRSPKGKRSLCVYDNARIVFGFLVTLCVFTRAVAMMKPAIPTGAACGGGTCELLKHDSKLMVICSTCPASRVQQLGPKNVSSVSGGWLNASTARNRASWTNALKTKCIGSHRLA